MADEPTDHPPFLGRELSASNAELNKKRKLQYEVDNSGLNKKGKLQYEVDNSGLRWPKQKYRDHFSSSAHEFLNFNSTKNDGTWGKEIISGEIYNKLGQSEVSDNNSNNSSRVDDNGIMLDLQAKEEKPIFLPNSQSESSHTSGHVISNKATEGCIPDLQSISSHASGHAISNKATEGSTPDTDETLQSEPRENATGNGLGANYIDSQEIAQYDMECWNAAQDDIMLYSNDVAPFLFSSERRRLGQDSRTKSSKPTIDQEFEHYFSMYKH